MIIVYVNCASGDVRCVQVHITVRFVRVGSTFMMVGATPNAPPTLNLISTLSSKACVAVTAQENGVNASNVTLPNV